ncbi:MAG: hypothetical protein Q9173_002416 [Seirophora scorigena]
MFTVMAVTYLKPGGKIGDVLSAEVTCDKFGKNLAYTSIKFTNVNDELVARGSHTKYVRSHSAADIAVGESGHRGSDVDDGRYVAQVWKDARNRVDELSLER